MKSDPSHQAILSGGWGESQDSNFVTDNNITSL